VLNKRLQLPPEKVVKLAVTPEAEIRNRLHRHQPLLG
jgi:hypothetical protein